MRTEGIDLPTGELGWFLREKLGLDPLRKQLLETALQGKERCEDVELEVLRLFKGLRVSDPLMRRAGRGFRPRPRVLPWRLRHPLPDKAVVATLVLPLATLPFSLVPGRPLFLSTRPSRTRTTHRRMTSWFLTMGPANLRR